MTLPKYWNSHIRSISVECSWRLADVLALKQKVPHPEIGASFPFFLLRTWVHAGFCMFPQSFDLRTYCGIFEIADFSEMENRVVSYEFEFHGFCSCNI
jgi:hypothetical protein